MKKLIVMVVFYFVSFMLCAEPLNKIVVFGDSLSDNGNLYEAMERQFPSEPYYKGRFSNGKVWVEWLAEAYFSHNTKAHLENYAFGGAGVVREEEEDPDAAQFTLGQEVKQYFERHGKANKRSLYVVWIGANNYLSSGIHDDKEQQPNIVLSGIRRELQRLVNKGARNILVVNLPDLGMTPAAVGFDMWWPWHLYSVEHNRRLRDHVSELQYIYPEVRWLYLDVYDMFTSVLINPEHYGFSSSKVLETCYDLEEYNSTQPKSMVNIATQVRSSSTDPKRVCDGYLFFDPIHPTSLAHRVLAVKSKELLDRQGIQFGSHSN